MSADPKVPGQFQLAHTKGSAFLSVRALARKAATNLNIRWNKRTYVFELIESDVPVPATTSTTNPSAMLPVFSHPERRARKSTAPHRPTAIVSASPAARVGLSSGRPARNCG